MSDEKKKVKDLATELSLTNKEVLAAAKELGIASAKVAASSLSEAEVSRLRGHFAPAAGPEKQQVIVRRRRKSADEPPFAEGAEAALSDVQETAAAQEPPQPFGSPAAEEAGPLASAEQVKAPPAREESKAVKVTTGARIVSRPVDLALKTPEEQAPEQTATEHKAAADSGEGLAKQRADERKEAPSPAARAQEAQITDEGQPARADADASGKDALQESAAPLIPTEEKPVEAKKGDADAEAAAVVVKEPKTEKKSTESAPQKPLVRVVRPAAFSAEPERGADGQALSSAPALPARSEQEDSGGDAQGIAQVRVISRPDARQGAGRPRGQAGHEGRTDSRQGQEPRQGQDPRGGFRPPRPGSGGDSRGGAPGGRPAPSAPGGRPAPSSPGGRPPYPPRPGGGGGAPAPFAPAAPDSEQGRKKRQKGRRTVDFVDTRSRSGDDDFGWSKSSSRKGGKQRKQRDVAMGGTQPIKAVKRKIKVDEFIRVADLAHQMALKSGEIIKVLFALGIMATINQSLDIDTATLVAGEFGYEIEKTGFSEQDIIESQQGIFDDNAEDYVTRPPVVTIMGHVDHGKTSLLDAVRKSSVVTGEAGGITQHIGAYHVKTKRGEIVFLDTPGHEAFTAMRARGAEVTDIVVLVVAADDGVMEQTREAINHARAAKVPIMVAVNKMDKEAANPDRVKRELADQGLVAEDWGGDTTFSYVSAKTRQGLDELLELLALQAEILELKGNPKRPAMGHIIEAKLDKGRGSLGTVLIQQGTLNLGDSFVCGVHSGRVRAMFNDQGKKVKEAGLSMPVEVQGFEGVPEAGEEFIVIADEKAARRIAESRALKQRERELAKESKITLETFLARKADSVEAEVLNLVVKADVQGSLEAITDALRKLSTEKVRINIIHGGTGAISESDVLLSTASNAIIIGFNVRPASKAKELAEQEKVDIRFYDIIYKLVEEIKSAMEGMLAPVSREVFLGTADVRETFSVPKIGVIAGCHVSDGKITRNAQVRLLRDGIVVHQGKISSLRRFKDDVREVSKGYECGIGLENFNDIKVGDAIETFEIVEEAATL